MPADDGPRLDDVQGIAPAVPNSAEHNPQPAVGGTKPRPPSVLLENGHLMAQGQNLQMNVCSIVKAGTERGEKATNHSNHGRRSLSPEWCNRNVFSADEVYGMHSQLNPTITAG